MMLTAQSWTERVHGSGCIRTGHALEVELVADSEPTGAISLSFCHLVNLSTFHYLFVAVKE
jgi:hypothetical protein